MCSIKLWIIIICVLCGYSDSAQDERNRNTLHSREYNDTLCESQINAITSGWSQGELWTIKALDSWAKLPAGIFKGNLVELGNFDECMEVNHDTTGNENVGIIKGQYCLATLNISQILSINNSRSINETHKISSITRESLNMPRIIMTTGASGLSQGICIPSSCSANYFQETLNNQTGLELYKINKSLCQQNQIRLYNTWDIITICLVGLVALLMIFSTCYDLLMTWKNESRNKYFTAFSMYTNGEKIFKCNRSKSENVLDCINGIRSLSIIWVIFGHSYLTNILRPQINLLDLFDWQHNFFSMLILGATVSVDSFFLLSGLLVTWIVLKELDQNRGQLNIYMMYLHRYIRLTPSLAFAILFFVTLSEHIVNGPIRPTLDTTNDSCREYWWSTLLYIQNYVNPNKLCLTHSWYLSVDMQLFILSPIILYPLWRWRNKFIWVIILLITLSMACLFATFMKNDYSVVVTSPHTQGRQRTTYFPTHTRYGPYLVGVLLGYLLHTFKGKTIHIPKIILLLGWTISLGSIFTIIFGLYPLYQASHITTTLESAFFESFSRVSWSICLAWIIFACVHGYGGPINWFLSLPQWQPIGRLSYAIYIVHVPIQLMLTSSVKNSSYFTNINTIHSFWGDFGLTLTVAIFWTMAFESPILTLEKLIFRERKVPISNSQENLTKQEETTLQIEYSEREQVSV